MGEEQRVKSDEWEMKTDEWEMKTERISNNDRLISWETLLQSVETDIHQNDNLPFIVILEESPIHWGWRRISQKDELMFLGDSSPDKSDSRMTILVGEILFLSQLADQNDNPPSLSSLRSEF